MKPVYIIGGDMRSCYMALYFIEKGYEVYFMDSFDSEMILNSGCKEISDIKEIHGIMILPVPVSKDMVYVNSKNNNISLADIIAMSGSCDMVCGGVVPDILENECKRNNTVCYDFMKDDEVACKNAIATAEGAIFDAFMGRGININGSKSLVTGYGRCAKPLAQRLKCMGSEVTIAARSNKARAEAEAAGYQITDFDSMKDKAATYDFCFNTVPALVIKEDFLRQVSSDILIIDIASKPGGVDFAYCDGHDIQYKHSLGIPGRYSPETSGRILAEAIIMKGF